MVLEAPYIKAKPTITWEPLPANFVLPDDPVEVAPGEASGVMDWSEFGYGRVKINLSSIGDIYHLV
jgi:hypothetical protein